MPRGRNFFGPGFWWRGYYGYPYWGWGGGNPFPFCRNFPWLPRWWWATPYAGQFASTIPYYFGAGYYPTFPGYPAGGSFYGMPPTLTPEQELEFLRNEAGIIKQQLEEINNRIKELEKPQK
ncbi:MAG: DUF5320 domain-containing protein [candidate division KSB1 bacterium]|nr:DUF5320 domain-containing protein [candidate division KSB1 bacterium]